MMSREELADLLGDDPRDAAPWVSAAAGSASPKHRFVWRECCLPAKVSKRAKPAAFAWFARAAETGTPKRRTCSDVVARMAGASRLARRWPRSGMPARPKPATPGRNIILAIFFSTETASRAIRDAAFRWYRRAADQGHPRAMSLVGRCFEEGWGTERDVIAALDWYRRSAEAGYFRGAFNFASFSPFTVGMATPFAGSSAP